jgi:hypothetical protein
MKTEIVILERIDESELTFLTKFADVKFILGLLRKNI